MRLYRITPEQYLENYHGLGASYQDGGRWNRAGQPVLYFALSASTALLEMSHYVATPRLVPTNYRLGIYEIPDSSPTFTLPDKQLPADWADFPYPRSTQTIGGDWLSAGHEMGLIVPSSAVPEGLEKIMVFNPSHPDVSTIHLIHSTEDLYNQRAFTGL